MPHPADLVYVIDNGMRLCASCAHHAVTGTLVVEDLVGMSVLTGQQQQRLTPVYNGMGTYSTVIERLPVEEPTACEACLAFLAMEER